MPATNNELEFALQRARTEPIPLPRLDRSGASNTGDVVTWDGSQWVPAPVPNDSLAGACFDLDGEPIVDLDGEPVWEPDDGGGFELNIVEWVQSVEASVWQIFHAFGRNPINVQVVDSSGNEFFPTVSFPTTSTVQVRWAFPMTGRVTILFS